MGEEDWREEKEEGGEEEIEDSTVCEVSNADLRRISLNSPKQRTRPSLWIATKIGRGLRFSFKEQRIKTWRRG